MEPHKHLWVRFPLFAQSSECRQIGKGTSFERWTLRRFLDLCGFLFDTGLPTAAILWHRPRLCIRCLGMGLAFSSAERGDSSEQGQPGKRPIPKNSGIVGIIQRPNASMYPHGPFLGRWPFPGIHETSVNLLARPGVYSYRGTGLTTPNSHRE